MLFVLFVSAAIAALIKFIQTFFSNRLEVARLEMIIASVKLERLVQERELWEMKCLRNSLSHQLELETAQKINRRQSRMIQRFQKRKKEKMERGRGWDWDRRVIIPHQQQHQHPPRPIHFYRISPGDNSLHSMQQEHNRIMEQYPVWTPYAERVVSPTSYWTSEEDSIKVVPDLLAQQVEGVGRESLIGEIPQSLSPLSQEPQMEVVTAADESLSREPHRTVQMVVGETLLDCFESNIIDDNWMETGEFACFQYRF